MAKLNAPEKRDDTTDTPVAPLVQVDDPAKLKNADINGATADGLKDSNSPKADAADTLAEARDQAKSNDEPEKGYNYGMGPGADV